MLRTMITAGLLAAIAAQVQADPLYQELESGERASEFKKGKKHLDNYFKAESDAAAGGKRGAAAQRRADKAGREFLVWFERTGDTLGVDLRTKPETTLHMIDEARAKYLNKKGFRKGKISFFQEEDPKGMSRLEYALLVPDAYDIRKFSTKVPLVVALHGRATDPKHPAFRGADSNERGRQVIHNYWYKAAPSEKLIVMAPTGKPGGFKFTEKSRYEDRQVLFRSLIEVMKKYRIDSNRVYLDAQGESLQVMCRQTFFFAGFILRDHVMNRRDPLIPKDRAFLLDNLNGKPLVYVADEKNWERVGKPTWEALQAAYQRTGKPENLKLIKAKRDPTTAGLKADAAEIWDHLQKVAPQGRQEPTEFKWRFADESYTSAGPVELMRPNFTLDVNAAMQAVPLEKKCGRLHYKASVVEEAQMQNGKPVMNGGKPVMISVNRIEISITECERIALNLHDGVVKLDLPVTVVVNGKTLLSQSRIDRKWDFFWNNVLPARFFMTPYVARREMVFEGLPEWTPPKEKKDAEGEGGKKDGADANGAGAKDDAGAKDAVKSGG